MNTTSPATTLTRFRAELYQQVLTRRGDAQCDLLDAVLTADTVSSAVRLSLEPVFRRRWSSVHDALSDGVLDPPAFQRLVSPLVADLPRLAGRQLWAIDGSSWLRPAAVTSPGRTACRMLVPGSAQQSIVDGWEYQWLVAIPDAAGSWVLPLSVTRRSLAAGTPTQLAIAQVRAVQAARGVPPAALTATADRPILLLDSSYDVGQLGEADLGVDLLARVATNRCFYRRPIPKRMGRPALHGTRFKVNDPTTHGEPDHTTLLPDPLHGTLRIDRWDRLHRIEVARLELSLIRIQFAHYAPRAHRAGLPPPLWLIWLGDDPPQAELFRTWYARRFAIEHAFRFLKQSLGWTTPRVRHPEAADRWSWLLAMGLWQLWLARQEMAAVHLPWERAVRHAPPTPGQVRRAFARLLLTVGTPARPPTPRGKAAGRLLGICPGRCRRYPARKRPPQPRPKRRNTRP